MIYPTYLNGIKVSGSGVPHISLTQAEYDALSVETKNNGTIYFITDAVGGSGEFAFIQNGDCYSTEERMIGCWTDGKPIYQKTIHIPNIQYDGNWHITQVNVNNYERLVNVFGTMVNTSNNSYPVNSYRVNSQMGITVEVEYIDTSTISVNYINTWIGAADYADVTIQYTKTTDTAGSGSWTPNGMPSIHYSTEEQIIGTWIDGSTLYEKTINFGAIPSYTTKDVAHNISNLGRVVDIKGVMNSDVFETMPSGENTNFRVIITSSVIRVISGGSWSNWNDSYITLRYTKS